MRRLVFCAALLAACSGKPKNPTGTPCSLDGDCQQGELCIDKGCTPGCNSTRDCPADKPQCDPAAGPHGQCVVCLTMTDCPSGMDCVMGACTEICTGNGDCPGGQICVEQACVAGCTGDRDCAAPTGRCDATAGEHGTCVECLSAADCGGRACDAGGACAGGSKLDVLFVIDNSNSMGAKQDFLATASQAFFDALAGGGALPDLHVGVVSSDIGVEIFPGVGGCTMNGDASALQHIPRTTGCAPPAGAFISDEIMTDGGRAPNYSGNIADVFNCIAALGTTGCGFEQHLESMKRALDGSNPVNAGFLRPDAYLAVVIFADEDDCSAQDPEMYDPSVEQDTLTSVLGPLGSFRCTEFGITCDGGNLSRGAADYTGCEPRGDSYLWHPQHYVDFLKSLKANPARIITAVIAGDSQPVGVMLSDQGEPLLKHSCMTSDVSYFADPAVRLNAFTQTLAGRFDSVCTMDYGVAMDAIGSHIRQVMAP